MSNELDQTGRYKGYSSEDFAMDEIFNGGC